MTDVLRQALAEADAAPSDLYKEAIAWGLSKAYEDIGASPDLSPVPESLLAKAQYWTAWWAGRRASDAVLAEAKRIGLTAEQYEALRVVAAEVAYD